MTIDDTTEWLEADGLGGFASGTTSLIRTRRYHALLLAATTPPSGRVVLVNGVEAWADTAAGSFPLSSQRYAPGIVYPDGGASITAFTSTPWPTWQFDLPDGTRLRQEIFVALGGPATVLGWEVVRAAGPVTLRVRLLLSGRDYHALHHENGGFDFHPEQPFDSAVDDVVTPGTLRFTPYDGLPSVLCRTDGEYRHAPDWYRNFLYVAERERGLDDLEDLATPGEFVWRLDGAGARADCILRATGREPLEADRATVVRFDAHTMRESERKRRAAFATPLDLAADAYLARRGTGRTILAGYPWFMDWGRDTFIAVRGLCHATGRLADARDILVEWAGMISQGMLPNRFPDQGETPEFNSVDASLWFVVAVHDLLEHAARTRGILSAAQRKTLRGAVASIVSGYAAGTRFGIRMDTDGLLMAGVPGVQLTWMDAKIGDWVVTPRVGKPVEVQALWLNALSIASKTHPRWRDVVTRASAAFIDRFWDDARGYLADVVDVNHEAGTRDDTFRPNQILAVGGLPIAILDGARARRVVDAVEERLLTPFGLRSLAPGEAGYTARYEGGPSHRDAVYHQGTVWPWLMGPFVSAWLGTRRNTAAARAEARRRFLTPLVEHLESGGLGHVMEIADAEPPFTPRGCPFQAWSLGELIRIDRQILASPERRRSPRRQPAQV
jgi:predicted glycogen debranching enzyme